MKDIPESNRIPRGRRRLVAVVREAGDVISIEGAARTLGFSRTQAAKLLSRWVAQGWLRRVGSGNYVPASIDSLDSEHVLEDPWVLVPALFAPAYIGGRTAAEYWDLTEQIFRDIVVITARTVRAKVQRRHGAQFTLKHVSKEKLFGTRTVWRGQTRIAVSDSHRTVIDMLDDPPLGAGIQHVADCLERYWKRPERNDEKLIEYGDRLGNGAVFKRLGFLAERSQGGHSVVSACLERLTKGNAKLDPSLDGPRLVTRWRLWVPATWVPGDRR
jgi:predicted transcriptional regulator of viral defense system